MVMDLFSLDGRVVVVTGAAGLLGRPHAQAIGAAGGIPILVDIDADALGDASQSLRELNIPHLAFPTDVCDEASVAEMAISIAKDVGPVWGLVNNVASNPPMRTVGAEASRLENYSIGQWDSDLRLGLTSALVCSREFGTQMATHGQGAIVNVASDLALIAPDQRVYQHDAPAGQLPPAKPISYSVTKSGLLGLTRYLSTYWAPRPIRCNALVPGSVGGTQSAALTVELETRIPLGRLADPHDYQGGLVFLLSDASAYMTGAMLVMDGGRTAW